MARSVRRYIESNVFCRCGRAVSRLVGSGLVSRPEMSSSEIEIYEWWLVSANLAGKLRTAGLPIIEFAELYMWGRTTAGVPLVSDPSLVAIAAAEEESGSPASAMKEGSGRHRVGARRSGRAGTRGSR